MNALRVDSLPGIMDLGAACQSRADADVIDWSVIELARRNTLGFGDAHEAGGVERRPEHLPPLPRAVMVRTAKVHVEVAGDAQVDVWMLLPKARPLAPLRGDDAVLLFPAPGSLGAALVGVPRQDGAV